VTARNSAADYTAQLRALLPRGRVWPLDETSGQQKVLACLGQAPARVDAAACGLLVDAYPTSAVGLLPEWEGTLGLPDPCLGPSPTIAQRQDQVGARLIAGGGQSVQHMIDFAAALGFDISVNVFAPFRAGRNQVGQPIYGPDWSFTWVVTILSGVVSADHAAFRVGQNTAGDPLATMAAAAAALECELNKIAPAHTTVIFVLEAQNVLVDGEFTLTDGETALVDDSQEAA
jgi:uncharacterized protein YmfQ (DUF2313 family)